MIKKKNYPQLSLSLIFGAFALFGCSAHTEQPYLPIAAEDAAASSSASTSDGDVTVDVLVERRSISSTSKLSALVEELDRVAVERSVALQDLRAAQAQRRAVEFDRFPRLLPAASAPLTGGGEPGFGLTLEQTIWDGGRTTARLTNADLDIFEARVRSWQDRNQVIYDGLSSFVGIQRYATRVAIYKALEKDLGRLGELLGVRVQGGVADRGEQLRMALSLQEVRREIVSDQSDRRAAEAELARLVPQALWPSGAGILADTGAVCDRAWPQDEVPDVARARARLMRAENQEKEVLARRMPRVLLGVGSSYTANGLSEPTAMVRLDASDMLGLGRKGSVEAAEASRYGAMRSYELEKESKVAELEKLEQDHASLLSDIAQLQALQRTNTENFKLYREQVEAGAIPLAEGITLYRERANTDLDLIDARARAIDNCLESARVRGTLAPFGMASD